MTPLPTGKDANKHTGRKDWLNMTAPCLFEGRPPVFGKANKKNKGTFAAVGCRKVEGKHGSWAHRSAHGSKFMVIRHCAPMGRMSERSRWRRAITRASAFARRCWLSVSVRCSPRESLAYDSLVSLAYDRRADSRPDAPVL